MIDFRNAFNNISRKTCLEQALIHFPDIYNYLYQLYSQEANLWVKADNNNKTSFIFHQILSKEGAFQGDSLAALLFALGMLPL